MHIQHVPVLGGPAPRHAHRTAGKLAGFALRFASTVSRNVSRPRYLDIGCGNGFITELIAPQFYETSGIDVEESRLREFREHIDGLRRIQAFRMSAQRMAFPDASFDFITCFEVLEHVADVRATVREIRRVCKQRGMVVLSVPQVWFPIENHGMCIGRRVFERKIPMLPYLRPLHRRFSLARVFSVTDLDRLFLPLGFEALALGYAAPQFDRAAARPGSWESRFTFLRSFLERCERIPILRALTGVSLLRAYRKLPVA